MPARTVFVVAHWAVKPDQIEDFIRGITRKLVEPSRKDRGCVRYELCQDRAEPARFAMVEEWETEADLEAHLAQPWLTEAVNALAPMISERPKVHRLRTVSGKT